MNKMASMQIEVNNFNIRNINTHNKNIAPKNK